LTEIEKSLGKLAEEINAEHHEFRRTFKATYRSALRVGDLLNEAKKVAGHGNWKAWVEENCEFSIRTAQVYMQIANNRELVEETLKSAAPAYLSIEGMLTRIAAPKGELGWAPSDDTTIRRVGAVPPIPVNGSAPEPAEEPEREPGVVERLQESPEGREALAEANSEFAAEGAYLRMRSKIHDLSLLIRHVPPEEAARREFAHHAADAARDAVLDRRRRRRIDQADDAVAVRDWLSEYIQRLKDADAHLRGLGVDE
jgi:hypothetical protein